VRDDAPTIAVSAGFTDYGDYLGVSLSRPIVAAGAIPVLLPYLEDDAARAAALDRADGLLLGFGRDIDPARYGAGPHPALTAVSAHRDEFELALVADALERDLPLLGICRGMQLLNVALGGTLVQDVRLKPEWSDHPSDRGWRAWKEVERASLAGEEVVPPHPRHPIAVAPGSRLHAALGVEEIEVDSVHHQALDRVAPELTVVARAPDGVVEAVEMDGDAYVLAVQWELQEEWRVDRRFLRPFEQFVAAAAERG
jgi:putative glutamine amidotransferase